jgi:hypothetical protein
MAALLSCFSDRRAGWLGYGWSVPLAVELALVYEAKEDQRKPSQQMG